jgi:DNA polymerase elongation subunit (family B)
MEALIIGWSNQELNYQVDVGGGMCISVPRDVIYAWCIDKNSERTAFRIENFKVEVAVRLGKLASVPGMAKEIFLAVVAKFPHHDWQDIAPDMLMRRPMFFYNEGEPYLVFRCPTASIARSVTYFLKSGDLFAEGGNKGTELDCSGAEREIYSHLQQRRDLWSQGWCHFEKAVIIPNDKRLSRDVVAEEYSIDYMNVKSSKNVYPVHPWIFSYDLEVNSGDGESFPQSAFISDYIGMASVVVWRYGKYNETKKDYLIVKGNIDDIPGVEVIRISEEEELIEEWEKLVSLYCPAVITHYNGDSFDTYYLDDRKYRLELEWGVMGAHKTIRTRSVDLWPSMNGRFRRGKALSIPGVNNTDLMKYIVENYKCRSYTLNSVSNEIIKKGKVDIGDYTAIFDAFRANDERGDISLLNTIARYGMEDSRLVAELYEATNQFDVLIGMSQASEVSCEIYNTKGRMKRTESMMYKMSNKVTPRLQLMTGRRPRPQLISGGGYVATPVTGLYGIVTTLDFQSLYPSIMYSFWICFSSVLSSVAANLPFEELKRRYPSIKSPADIRNIRCDQDEGTYRYKIVKTADAILPKVVEGLLSRRAEARREMTNAESVGDMGKARLLNIRQLAIKISGNSVYGFTNAPGEDAFPEASQMVTALGRALIKWVRLKIYEKSGYKCIYGDTDSVMIHINDTEDLNEARTKSKELLEWLNEQLAYIETDDNGDLYIIPPEKREGVKKKILILTLEKIARMGLITGKNYYMVHSDISKPVVALKRKENGKLDIKATGVPSVKRDRSIAFSEMYDEIGYHAMDMQDLRKINEVVWERAIEVIYDLSDPEFASIPYSKFAHSGRIGKVYNDDSNAGMSKVYHRMARENTPIAIGVRFDYYIANRLGATKQGDKIVLGTEIEKNRKLRLQGSDIPVISVDRYSNYEKRFTGVIDKMIKSLFAGEIRKYKAKQYDRRIQKALELVYLQKGRILIEALTIDPNPCIALGCCEDRSLAELFKSAYNKPQPLALISGNPAAAALKYFSVRKRVLEEIRRQVR